MPVNWTSGKASKKPRTRGNGNNSQKRFFPSRRYPIAKKKLAQPEPIPSRLHRDDGLMDPSSWSRRIEGSRSTEESETISVGNQNPQNSTVSGHQTTTSNHQKIDIERKRRALLALPDWAGLHPPTPSELGHQTHPVYQARLRGNAMAEVTPPQRVVAMSQASEEEGFPSLESHYETHYDVHDHTFSLSSSSHDPIVSPTPTSPRVKKPTRKFWVPTSKKGSVVTGPCVHNQVERSIIHTAGLEPKPRASDEKHEGCQEAPPADQHPLAFSTSSKADQASGSRAKVPPWICRVSEALGFSPPNEISVFAKPRALLVESHHSLSPAQHEATPDLELFLQTNASSSCSQRHCFRQGKISEEPIKRQGIPVDSRREIRNHATAEDQKGNEGVSEERKEEHENRSAQDRACGSLVNQQKSNQLATSTPPYTPTLPTKTHSDWKWRNLVLKSANDQFELLFHDRKDDERIF
ncbi:uncharacterized protein VP01_777g3 [Puccinia sorghi]|uniref:Uncharacterized protein n=1 Tax=Puccinia sorghi TaxID=27349 RepID=A0A0L6UC41_9BASI|nr:uncharacterized protein VP01_777g3 [Puccinia sorghi]